MIENIIEKTILLLPNHNTAFLLNKLCKKYKARGNRAYDIEVVAIALTNDVQDIATFNTKDFEHIDEVMLYQ